MDALQWRTSIHNSGTDRSANFRGEIGFNYEPDAHQSFGVRYVPGKLFGKARSRRTGNTVVCRDGSLVEELNSVSSSDMTADWSHSVHSVNAYYNATFGSWGVDFNADYYTSDRHTGQKVMYDGVVDASSINDVSNRLYAVKLVLSRQIGKGQLSVGTEETFTDRRDRFTQSGFSADADDHLRQSYYSVFADYGITLGRFSLLAGRPSAVPVGRLPAWRLCPFAGLQADEIEPVLPHAVERNKLFKQVHVRERRPEPRSAEAQLRLAVRRMEVD